MTSIIKVDQIQTAAGDVPTAGDLGLDVTGSVLQVVRHSIISTTGVSSSSYTATGHTVTITPKRSNSIILVEFKGGRSWIPSAGNQIDLAIAINGDTSNLVGRRMLSFWNSAGTLHTPVYGSEYHTNVGTNAITYAAYFRSSGPLAYLNDASSSFQQTLVATEIAG